MPSRWTQKIASVLTFTLFITNSLLAYAPETSFWKEREQQTAALPIGSQPRFSALLGVPSGLAINQPFASGLSARWGQLRQVNLPKDAQKTILYIQDIHMNPEAQANIGAAVENLVESGKVDLIGLEGAFGDLDFKRFQKFPRPRTTQALSEYLFQKNLLSGPAYAAMRSRRTLPPIVGVDDKTHYDANVAAYRDSLILAETVKRELDQKERMLAGRKNQVFNAALLDLDRVVVSYRAGKTPLGDYVVALAETTPELPLPVEIFLSAVQLEKTFDFQSVEKQRDQLLRHLIQKLSQTELDALMARGAAFRAGQINQAEFYSDLRKLCVKKNVPLAKYPDVDRYVQYVLLIQSLDAEPLLAQIHALEIQAYEKLARRAEEKTLIAQSRTLHLEQKLVEFSLTPKEWAEIQKTDLTENVFAKFYREAEARNAAITNNLLKAMEARGAKTAVLVTGGFHTPGIMPLLKEARCEVLTFTPRITKVDDIEGAEYLSVFAREKAPLDQIFKGEKLFTAPAPVLASQVEIGALGVAIDRHVGAGVDVQTVFADLSGLQVISQIVTAEPTNDGTLVSIAGPSSVIEVTTAESSGQLKDHKVNVAARGWPRLFRAPQLIGMASSLILVAFQVLRASGEEVARYGEPSRSFTLLSHTYIQYVTLTVIFLVIAVFAVQSIISARQKEAVREKNVGALLAHLLDQHDYVSRELSHEVLTSEAITKYLAYMPFVLHAAPFERTLRKQLNKARRELEKEGRFVRGAPLNYQQKMFVMNRALQNVGGNDFFVRIFVTDLLIDLRRKDPQSEQYFGDGSLKIDKANIPFQLAHTFALRFHLKPKPFSDELLRLINSATPKVKTKELSVETMLEHILRSLAQLYVLVYPLTATTIVLVGAEFAQAAARAPGVSGGAVNWAIAGVALGAGGFVWLTKNYSSHRQARKSQALADTVRGAFKARVRVKSDLQNSLDQLRALVPVTSARLNDGFLGRMSEAEYTGLSENLSTPASAEAEPLALTLQQKREVVAQLDGRSFGTIVGEIGNGNLILDVRLNSSDDVAGALSLLREARAQMGTGTLYVPAALELPQADRDLITSIAGIELIFNEGGFYDANQVFNLDRMLVLLGVQRLGNTFIGLQGDYFVSDNTWDFFTKQNGLDLRMMLLAEWLEGVIRAIVVDRATLDSQIDRIAKLTIYA